MATTEGDCSRFHCQSLARTSRLFGPDGLLRRHEYTVDVMGGASGLNYAAEYCNVDGIVVPMKRRVYASDANKQKIPDPVLVAIDISYISFSDGK